MKDLKSMSLLSRIANVDTEENDFTGGAVEEQTNTEFETVFEASPSAVRTKLPVKSSVLCTIADVSEELESNGRKFRMVNYVDAAGTAGSIPVNAAFFERNAGRFQPDSSVVMTMEDCVEGKTHWVDKETNEVNVHTYTGTSLTSVVKATKDQTEVLRMKSKMAFLQGVESRITDADAASQMALATFYGNALR